MHIAMVTEISSKIQKEDIESLVATNDCSILTNFCPLHPEGTIFTYTTSFPMKTRNFAQIKLKLINFNMYPFNQSEIYEVNHVSILGF